MKKIMHVLGIVFAIGYFFSFFFWGLVLMLISPLQFYNAFQAIIESGFASINFGVNFLCVISIFIAPTLLLPPLRRYYDLLPWLFPYVKIIFLDILILSLSIMLLNYGYAVQNEARHTIFLFLTGAFLIVARLLMCLYFHKKPMIEERENG